MPGRGQTVTGQAPFSLLELLVEPSWRPAAACKYL